MKLVGSQVNGRLLLLLYSHTPLNECSRLFSLETGFMQAISLNDRQSRELCDEVGKMLAIQLDSDAFRNKVNRVISDYLKRKDVGDDAKSIAKSMSWSVKVELKK